MRPYRKQREQEPQSGKVKSMCRLEDCEALWTHSDVPGSYTGMCGYHYHAKLGEQELADWKIRNTMAREDARRMRSGLSRYVLNATPAKPEPGGVFEQAALAAARGMVK